GKNYVAFNATIIGIKRTDVGTFIKVKDNTGVIDVVVFDEKINTTGLNAGMSVKIIGKVQRYKGKLEIIPSSILR
ncbi:MAG: OB-fold nucleic acid binding domain-containing protein, partial [Candidatus Aenigmatarchaeota archaeon]